MRCQLPEPRKDQADDLLDAQIGIKAETDLAMPGIADRHRDTQLTTPRLGASSIEHASAQYAKLELADAALHAQQQSVVWPAWIVDAVQVDHPRLDQSAEFEQMMPVAAVAGEPRGIEAQHGADLSGAKPGDQTFKARPCHRAAGGSSEIIIDHLDLPKAAGSRDIDQFILAASALGVCLNLRLGRLADVDHRLALQQRGRKSVSRVHRRSPSRHARSFHQEIGQARDHRVALGLSHSLQLGRVERHDSWRAVEWRSCLADVIVLLPGDIRVVRGVSADSECNQ